MARQAGPLFITGTIDDLVFYKLGEHYYVRQKGERTPGVKKRLKQDEGYALLQLKQREFGRASELVKTMYYTLPLEVRKQGLFGTLTGKAVRWLRQGKSEEEIKELVQQDVMSSFTEVTTAPKTVLNSPVQTGVTKNQRKQHFGLTGVHTGNTLTFALPVTSNPINSMPLPRQQMHFPRKPTTDLKFMRLVGDCLLNDDGS